eukprot:COSAG06_NODE_25338_length_639_cov_1.229630_2_plen_38_part_01
MRRCRHVVESPVLYRPGFEDATAVRLLSNTAQIAQIAL